MGLQVPERPARAEALDAVREHFQGQGATSLGRMKNGMDLEATLMRRGLPFDVDEHTRLAGDWLQVCQRISQSEDGLARWEVGRGHGRPGGPGEAGDRRMRAPVRRRRSEYQG